MNCFFTIILSAASLVGHDFRDFDSYQYTLSAKEVEEKINTYLEKDPSIRAFYSLGDEAFYIGNLAHQELDYVLHLKAASEERKLKSSKHRGLKNVKIALDPGHFGGEFAKLEERFIEIPPDKTKDNQAIYFDEGTLTYLTAIRLKSLLESEGAEVFMTRSSIGKGAIEQSFFEWLAGYPKPYESSFLSKIFRFYYNRDDLIARAELINAFHPDITVILHYNAHHSAEEKQQKALLTQSNYNLVFIPGAFCDKELSKVQDRYEFLRMIVTDDLEQSLKLSEKILTHCVNDLQVPVIPKEDKNSYTKVACLLHQPGLYSRNLMLTRLIHGPLCYGETLVQNNENEVYRLSAQDNDIAGYSCSKRLEEVAQAYFKGIQEYFNSN